MRASKIYDILALYNSYWSSGKIDAGIERDCLEPVMRQVDSKEVVVLQGARRSGKSTLMDQVVRNLLKGGFPPERILRVNLEEPLLATEYSIELLERVYRTYRERVMPEGRCVLFLDEVQNIDGWESWVRGRSETEDMKIFLTGSSARMLSREIGSKLTGRHVSFEIYPLSFREFLRFNDIEISSEADYAVRKAVVRNMLLEYMRHGGFPEVVLKKEATDKLLLLKSYFEDIVFRDVAARHEIRDTSNLMNLAVYLFTNIARKTSVNLLGKYVSKIYSRSENENDEEGAPSSCEEPFPVDMRVGVRQEWYKADKVDPEAFGFDWPAEEAEIDENHLAWRPWKDGSVTARFGISHRYPTSPRAFLVVPEKKAAATSIPRSRRP